MANESGRIEYVLKANSELRFELEGESVYLELKNGMAEVFGSEIIKLKKYLFLPGAKVAVFTWHGCTLEITGKTEVSYIAQETPMVMYLNTHAALEQLRQKAEKNGTRGPVCMVVGPSDVGKSTLCRMLANYAVRRKRQPVLVDLDVGQGHISVPGAVGALLVERLFDVEGGYYQQTEPLVYHYGYKDLEINFSLYKLLISRLSKVVSMRLEKDRKTNNSGIIVNTSGLVKGFGYQAITFSAQAFQVDVVVVLGQERLYNELVRDLPSFTKILFLPKSGGVVGRSQEVRDDARNSRIREYFYGFKSPVYPHCFDVNFSDVKIFKIDSENDETKMVSLSCGLQLLHHLFAVSSASCLEKDPIQSNIVGYICVTAVDMQNKRLTVLSPQRHPLPKKVLILSDIQFMDLL